MKTLNGCKPIPHVLLGPFSYQRYEDMKDDFETVIKEVATFLGKEVTTQ